MRIALKSCTGRRAGWAPGRWFGQFSSLLLATACVAVSSQPAAALVVVSGGAHDTAPADDPGWDYVTTSGRNFVYLGDGWALSARHVGPTENDGETLTFSSGTYELIPGQNYVVHNPASSGYSTETDLRLVRLQGGPDLEPLAIADTVASASSEVTIISEGRPRLGDMYYWDVNTSVDPWVWTESTVSDYDYRGYKTTTPTAKLWGTNRIATASSVYGTSNAVSYVQGLISINGRDVVSVATKFDLNGTANEAQAVSGDSGGAMFRKNGSQWELAGIVSATFVFGDGDGDDQPTTWAIYGNATSFVDLSYYYHGNEAEDFDQSISDIMRSHPEYSVIGDLNLDGEIWDGTGDPAAAPDIAAFVAGWMSYDYGAGNVDSWQQGDMNLDGRTDVEDFLLMRGALNPTSAGSLASLLSIGGISPVPEPAAALLMLAGIALAAIRCRRRRCLAG